MHRLVVSVSTAALGAAVAVVALAAPAAATEEPNVCVYVLVQGEDLEEFRPINPCLPVAATDCYGTNVGWGRIVVITAEACVIGP